MGWGAPDSVVLAETFLDSKVAIASSTAARIVVARSMLLVAAVVAIGSGAYVPTLRFWIMDVAVTVLYVASVCTPSYVVVVGSSNSRNQQLYVVSSSNRR
jgi:hypothetical protein